MENSENIQHRNCAVVAVGKHPTPIRNSPEQIPQDIHQFESLPASSLVGDQTNLV
jgi:hypothetical protein